MKFAHPALHFTIEIGENLFPVLSIEAPALLRSMVEDLLRQADGSEGSFVLSENWEPIPIHEKAVFLYDPFHIDMNDRKALSALYKNMQQLSVDPDHFVKTQELLSSIHAWLIDMESDMEMPVTHSGSIDIPSLLKAVEVRYDTDLPSLLDTVVRYMHMVCVLRNTRLMICYGFHSIFSASELSRIYDSAAYEKLPLLMLDGQLSGKADGRERIFVVDKDLCEIYDE